MPGPLRIAEIGAAVREQRDRRHPVSILLDVLEVLLGQGIHLVLGLLVAAELAQQRGQRRPPRGPLRVALHELPRRLLELGHPALLAADRQQLGGVVLRCGDGFAPGDHGHRLGGEPIGLLEAAGQERPHGPPDGGVPQIQRLA